MISCHFQFSFRKLLRNLNFYGLKSVPKKLLWGRVNFHPTVSTRKRLYVMKQVNFIYAKCIAENEENCPQQGVPIKRMSVKQVQLHYTL